MTDLLKTEEEEWVEISDGEGHTAALRHLATVRDGEKTYHVLGAFTPKGDGEEGEGGFLLIREDATADGAQEYVVASDENEVERVIGSFVLQAMALFAASQDEDDEEDGVDWQDEMPETEMCPCGEMHAPGEFCVCGQSELLQ